MRKNREIYSLKNEGGGHTPTLEEQSKKGHTLTRGNKEALKAKTNGLHL